MSLTYRGTPPKMGMEIEANWPLWGEIPLEIKNNVSLNSYQFFAHGVMGSASNVKSHATDFCSAIDPKYHFPHGWYKSSDSGCELKFDGPVSTLEHAETLVDRAVKWLNDFGFHAFRSAGTHVHLGHVAWCEEMFGTATIESQNAEALLFGYFLTRENALFQVASPHRRNCGSCIPYFRDVGLLNLYNSRVVCDRRTTTPRWAIKQHLSPQNLYDNFNLFGSCIQPRRKSLPTLEFRFFEGTKNKPALMGYLRLLRRMFLNATNFVTKETINAKNEEDLLQVFANPFTYTADDLLKEVSDDPYLVAWIKATLANNGNPIATEPEFCTAPEAVAAA